MSQLPPAEPGMHLSDVETPALLIELDAFERNVATLAARVSGTGVRLRPHAKTHKSAVIALRDEMTAVQRWASVSEGGRSRSSGLRRCARCACEQSGGRRAQARAACGPRRRRRASASAWTIRSMWLPWMTRRGDFGVRLEVLVEVNVGMDRCGVDRGSRSSLWRRLWIRARNLAFRRPSGVSGLRPNTFGATRTGWLR